jgi:hypothetical protein
VASEPRRGLGRITGAVTGRVIDAIDPDTVLDHIDVNAVLDRVDLNALLDRVDIDRLLDRVDVDRLLARSDIEALVRRSGIPEIVTESTGRFAGSALDTGRRQLVVVDVLTGRAVDALFRRRTLGWAHDPLLLRPSAPRFGRDGRLDVSGRYAGWLTRLVASVADVWVVVTGGTLLLAGVDFLADGRSATVRQSTCPRRAGSQPPGSRVSATSSSRSRSPGGRRALPWSVCVWSPGTALDSAPGPRSCGRCSCP